MPPKTLTAGGKLLVGALGLGALVHLGQQAVQGRPDRLPVEKLRLFVGITRLFRALGAA